MYACSFMLHPFFLIFRHRHSSSIPERHIHPYVLLSCARTWHSSKRCWSTSFSKSLVFFSRWCSHQGCRRHLQACLREEPHMLAWKLLNAPPSLPLLDLQNYVSLSLFEDPWKEPEWWPCVVRDPSSYPIAASSKLIQSMVALWLHSCMPLSRWF